MAMPVRTQARIQNDEGDMVTCKPTLKYLGCVLAADGRVGPELGRRLAMARAEFETLRRIWAHSSLSRGRKLEVFNACVVSRLKYGLFTAVLYKADMRRLDGFQARCLRRIHGIRPAFYSRVSNATVLQCGSQRPLSEQISEQKLQFVTELALRDPSAPFRNLIFHPDGLLRETTGKRNVRRPRTRWTSQTLKLTETA